MSAPAMGATRAHERRIGRDSLQVEPLQAPLSQYASDALQLAEIGGLFSVALMAMQLMRIRMGEEVVEA